MRFAVGCALIHITCGVGFRSERIGSFVVVGGVEIAVDGVRELLGEVVDGHSHRHNRVACKAIAGTNEHKQSHLIYHSFVNILKVQLSRWHQFRHHFGA